MIEVIKQYQFLKEHFGEILELSGYRLDYLAQEIGMKKESLYVKKQRKSFTDAEMEQLLKIVWTDRLEEKILLKNMLEIKENDVLLTEEEKADLFD